MLIVTVGLHQAFQRFKLMLKDVTHCVILLIRIRHVAYIHTNCVTILQKVPKNCTVKKKSDVGMENIIV